MTTITADRGVAGFDWFGRWIRSTEDRARIRVTREALRKLSDRQLEDIGLTRGDIDTVARGGRPA